MFLKIKDSFKFRLLVGVAIMSLSLNILVILPYVKPYYNKFEKKIFPPEYFTTQTPDKDVLSKVCEATLQMGGVKMSMNESKGLPEDLKAFFKKERNTSVRNNFYTSYAMVGLSYFAISQRDSITMNALREKSNRFLNMQTNLNYEIEKVDQIPIGLLFLNLYKWYKNDIYLRVAKNLFEIVQKMRERDGSIRYSKGSDVNFVDAVGMYIPFLMEYFNVTKDSMAYEIADHNMKVFYEKGIEHETGMPVHGYNIKTGLHVGSANWGRGIGWYLLAAAFCPQINDPRLWHTLSMTDYTQFPGCDDQFDSSTALMFEIYKQSKDENRILSLNFIKPHIRTNGFVDDCSGDTYGFNDYSHTFGESELCNGLLLILASKFDNKY